MHHAQVSTWRRLARRRLRLRRALWFYLRFCEAGFELLGATHESWRGQPHGGFADAGSNVSH